MTATTPVIRVIVEPMPARKGWHWRQVTRNGATGAVSPKPYDTKATAKRAGERQVQILNAEFDRLWEIVDQRMTPDELAQFQQPYAVLVVN